MTHERLKQRITYLVEHGGVLPREEARCDRRILYLVAAVVILHLVVELVK